MHTGREREKLHRQAGIHPPIHTHMHTHKQSGQLAANQHTKRKEGQQAATHTDKQRLAGIHHTYVQRTIYNLGYIHTYIQPGGQTLSKADRGRHDAIQTNMHTYIQAYALAHTHRHTYA